MRFLRSSVLVMLDATSDKEITVGGRKIAPDGLFPRATLSRYDAPIISLGAV